MGLSFRETMWGSVETRRGGRRFRFVARATSGTLAAGAGWGPLWLAGTARVGRSGAALGPGSSLEIGLPFRRLLRYHVQFTDAAGHRWRFFGRKDVRLSRPWRTLTTLRGVLFRDGVEVGPAELRFRFRDLARFLASWRPWQGALADRAATGILA
jgi:hypothetical protein